MSSYVEWFRRFAIGLIAVQSAFCAPATAQRVGEAWIPLLSVAIAPSTTVREIEIPEVARRITALRLLSREAAVAIARISVAYANGQVHYEERRLHLVAGRHSSEIDARDEARTVASMTIELEQPRSNDKEVLIDIEGRTEPDRPSDPSNASTVSTRPVDKRPGGGGMAAPRGSTDPESKTLRKYVEVGVFFGSNRRQQSDRIKNGRRLATFSGEMGSGLALGRAVVTVPIERERGTIPRPGIEIFSTRISLRKEDPDRDFTLAAVDIMSVGEFSQQLGSQIPRASRFKDQAFVFVHGYNVAFDDAIFRTAQIAYDIGFDGPAVTFSWPSRGGTWDYRHDIDTAKVSRDALRELLQTVATVPGISKINLVAHSMGSDPVVELLSQLGEIRRSGGNVPDLKLNELVLAAPDISRSAFEQFATRFVGIARGGVTLYASRNDRALQASKGIARGIARAGDVPSNGIVVVRGVDSIDISDASTGFFSSNHSAFADREHLIEDMRLLFARSMRPPHERFAVYRVEGKLPSIWWRYRKN